MTERRSNEFYVFPAHAGVIPLKELRKSTYVSFSRTRGGDPSNRVFVVFLTVFFPHTRG